MLWAGKACVGQTHHGKEKFRCSIQAKAGLGQLFLQMHSWLMAPVDLLGSEEDSVYETPGRD